MPALRKSVLYSTLFAVFGSRFLVIVGGLTLFYFYFIVLINLTLLVLLGYWWAPTKLRWFFAYLVGSGVLGLMLGTNSTAGFLKSITGIIICALYSATFMRFINFNALELFRRYAKLSFYSAVLGLLLLPVSAWSHGRLVSVFLEPSAFAIVCMPAVFYYADVWQRTRQHGARLVTLTIAYILTLSSLGYIGLMTGACVFGLRYRFGKILMLIIFPLAFFFTLQQSTMFQTRIGDTFSGLNQGDVTNINLSSLGVVANALITERQFAEHPFLGGGLGSHVVTHDRFIGEVPGAMFLPEEYRALGQWDASSLFLRIVSELGLVGVCGAFWFLWYYFPRSATPEERSVASALICYVCLKLLRSGEYFGSEQFFFLSIYTIIGVKARLRVQAATKLRSPALTASLPLTTLPAESYQR